MSAISKRIDLIHTSQAYNLTTGFLIISSISFLIFIYGYITIYIKRLKDVKINLVLGIILALIPLINILLIIYLLLIKTNNSK
jgi:hypothetical protein